MIDIEQELNKFLRERDKLGTSVLDIIEKDYMGLDFLKLIEEYLIQEFDNSEIGEHERQQAYEDGYSEGYNEGCAYTEDVLREDGIL